jgi:transcription elongation factor GreA
MGNKGQILSLEEAALSFLTTLSSQERKEKQQEVNRFVLWYGKERPIDQITALEVANYAERVGASTGDAVKKLEPVKAFLSYVKKEGLVKTSLAPHLRVRQTLLKTPRLTKSKQQVALTAQDYVQLKSQLATLEEERLHIAEELRLAAADKDFRENAPLEAAREHRDQVEARIKELQTALRTGVVIEEKPVHEFMVKLRSKVILCDIASGMKFTYTLVTKNETNPAENKISIDSPMGKALLNQRQGDIVKVIAPAGELHYQIEKVE